MQTRPSGPWDALCFAVVFGLVLFGFVLGFGLLSPSAPVWANPPNDMAKMLSGFTAVIQDGWRFPPTLTQRLTAPQTVSVVYVDAIPWLTVTLKALGLGEAVNPLGLFYLLSYLLQPIGMIALMRACGAKRAAPLALGAVLALLLPTWIVRQFGHVSLTGHWLILFAMALSVVSAREGLSLRRTVCFVLLGALATGIHAYHIVPIAICAGAAYAAELLQRGWKSLPRILVAGAAFSAGILGTALLFGYPYGAGEGGNAASLGFYGMNLLGPVMPQASALFGQHWDGNWYTGVVDPTGGQTFEGYQYFGAGILLVLLAGAVAGLRAVAANRPAASKGWWLRWGPLAAGMVVLTAAAIGPKLYLGNLHLFDLPPPPGKLGEFAVVFRCHGRFFWAVAYLLIALAIGALERGTPRRLLIGLGLVAVVLQLADLGQLYAGVRSKYAKPELFIVPKALAAAPALKDRPWRFAPTYFCTSNPVDQLAIVQLSLMAIRQGGDTDSGMLAHDMRPACDVAEGLLADARPGDPRIAAVFDDGKQLHAFNPIFAARSDCYDVGRRGFICGAGLQGLGLPRHKVQPPPAAPEGVADYRFDNGQRPGVLLSGWSAAEPPGTWSDGSLALMAWTAPPSAARCGTRVSLDASGVPTAAHPLRQVQVSANGARIATWSIGAGFQTRELTLPPAPRYQLSFAFPDAEPPGNGDPRLLTMMVRSLRLEPSAC